MFCCMLLYVRSSIAISLMGKIELVALLNLSSWCLVMVERLFLAVPRGCLQFVIVVFPDHTHYFCIFNHLSDVLNTIQLVCISDQLQSLLKYCTILLNTLVYKLFIIISSQQQRRCLGIVCLYKQIDKRPFRSFMTVIWFLKMHNL